MTTRITIELTDQEVEAVRAGGIVDLYDKVKAALPALPQEPVRLEIDLPDIEDLDWIQWAIYSALVTYKEGDWLTPTGAILMTTVVSAIRNGTQK